MSSSFISNPQNRRLSLNLYRSLLRKCNHFDSNPKYKAFFVTPPSLRYQLPTFFLPSVSFTQNLKVLFRLYAKYEYPTQNQSDKEQSILQDVEMKKPNSLASESNLSPEINDIIASLQESVTKKAINIDINDIDDQSLKTTATNNINNSINDNNNNVKIDKDKQKESNNNNSIVTPIPLVNLNSNNTVAYEFGDRCTTGSIRQCTATEEPPVLKESRTTLSIQCEATTLTIHQDTVVLRWSVVDRAHLTHRQRSRRSANDSDHTSIQSGKLLTTSTLIAKLIIVLMFMFMFSDKIKTKEIPHESVMMMVGCSLWKPGELRKLIDQGAWFQADCTNEQIFKLGKDEKFWAEALQSMGGDYRDLINN
ncbi:hypothetical protein PPL_00868 [Heterostelium album PN500]|uniref:Uncharacterized protein n=1 Tax=Heterostelium pallidum (strain ATCC 26659 / Pp 5 / PN500) TaxID=670386 RepID=D3AYU9_HETP5|nr:hypothetical protein PPL_00868 [Heterostelium album PN500]EFA85639.1 hypothetical protein PPL_00868 [Heterostelium album PN500]|eukprot:XP_020437746.1 hypothetical protein PPL_00868 [Heterostelium album PN500]